MRLRLTFACEEGKTLAYNYNHYLVEMINRAMRQTCGDLRTSNRSVGMYTFSQLYLSQYCVGTEGIINLGHSVEWFVSSVHGFFLEQLVDGLRKLPGYKLNGFPLELKEVTTLSEPEYTETMEFSCMSPLTVFVPKSSAGRARYLRLEEGDYVQGIRQNLVEKYRWLHGHDPDNQELNFQFNTRYISNKSRVSRLIDFRGFRILGYMVPFVVTGNPELIKIGYQMGFGHKNEHGFGMVKVWYRPITATEPLEKCI